MIYEFQWLSIFQYILIPSQFKVYIENETFKNSVTYIFTYTVFGETIFLNIVFSILYTFSFHLYFSKQKERKALF